jgi:hypothetical protein
MLALILLATMAVLTCGQAPVKLNGSEGLALLNNLTKVSLNQTNKSSSGFWFHGLKPKNYSLYGSPETDYLSDPEFNMSGFNLSELNI